MYRVSFSAYCGLSRPYLMHDDRAAARKDAAAILRRRRRLGLPCVTLERGARWEVLEPEGALMVPDDCGLLALEHVTYECEECGSEHETLDEARACCQELEPATFSEGGKVPEGYYTATAPSVWASYLINGDASGLEAWEAKQCDAWLEGAGNGAPIDCRDAGFIWQHDARSYGALAADCQEYLFKSEG